MAPAPDRNATILLVETDETLALRIAADLNSNGYETAIARDAQQGLSQARQHAYALIAVDRMLAGESGLWLCRRLRDLGYTTPILLMMARDAVEDRAACLDAGADDYFLKPYRADLFLHLVRLYANAEAEPTQQLRFADLRLDLNRRVALRNGQTIDLTMKEFDLLKYLMEHPGEALSREQILENVWGYDFMGESNVIEVYIRYLRLKLEDEGRKRLIQTVRGVGYVLREP
jgi:OmpR family response regulator NblR